MIPKNKIRELAGKLLEKTRAEQVRWTYHPTVNYGCVLLLPHSSFEIAFDSPPAEPDKLTVTLNKEDGGDSEAVAELTVVEGDQDWELYRSLFGEASRRVFGWDKVLDELQTAVNAPGPIGLDQPE